MKHLIYGGAWVPGRLTGRRKSKGAGRVHAFPTLAEILKKAAGSYDAETLFSDRTRKILRFLFGLKGGACPPQRMSG